MERIKAEDKYLEIRNLRLHYLDWGNGKNPPMLLLHGFMGHAKVWDAFSLEFRSDYHVMALDQRGHGESQWSKEASYGLDEHFADLAGFVETLDLYDLVLIGHSMGGRNALFYTACIPERVQRLVMVDSRPGNSKESCNALEQLLFHLPLQAESLAEVVESLRVLYPYMPKETTHHIVKYGYTLSEQGKYVPKYDTRMGVQCSKTSYVTESIWPFLRNIICPTMVVRGKESPFFSKEDAEQMCRILPNAVLREISQATHVPPLENPEAFAKVVWEFLES